MQRMDSRTDALNDLKLMADEMRRYAAMRIDGPRWCVERWSRTTERAVAALEEDGCTCPTP